MRWGLGPVFIYECLGHSRRWQTYALRSVGVAALFSAMGTIATSTMTTLGSSARDYANLGEAYFIAMIGVELALVMLAAPAATAGAICLDRARGTLAHMLMTDLSDPEIVLGKLAARLLPVFGLVACTWPVMAISSLLGGIDPIALTLAFAIIVTVSVLGCTIALALSVWARKSYEVILATFTFFIVALLLWPVWYFLSSAAWVGGPPPWALLANPFYVAFAPYADPGKLGFLDYSLFFGAALGASTLLTVLAVWRMRPVACRGSAEGTRGPRIGVIGRIGRWLPGPSLDRDPVLWREWHRSRPSRWMTAILALLMGTTGALCIVGAIALRKNGVDFRPGAIWEVVGACSYVLHIVFGLLILAAIAPTSMAEERQRGSLDILAATALSSRAIVIGKWLGTFRLVVLLAVAPGLMALAMATGRSRTTLMVGPGLPPDYYRVIPLGARIFGVVVVITTILAHGAMITSVGLAMAVWIKRQSRAIAMSVGSFILVTAAWPIFASTSTNANWGRNLAGLSPVVTCGVFVRYFTIRRNGFTDGILWSSTFWAVEVFVFAMGLLWLTVLTFDSFFDRIRDSPRRTSVWAVAAIILAAMTGAGSLVGAIACWVDGFKPVSLSGPSSLGFVAYSTLIAIGLVLVAVDAAKSGDEAQPFYSNEAPERGARSFALGRWWGSFRLVLFVAIGPALLALALATAHKPPRFEPQFTTNAAGAQVFTSYVLARTDIPSVGEVQLRQRLMIAAVLIATILVHGAAALSIGLGLANVNRWSRSALAAAIAFAALMVLFLPLYVALVKTGQALDIGGCSLVMALDSMLELLYSRTSFSVAETLWPVMISDVVIALFAVALAWWTSWVWHRRTSGEPKPKPSLATDFLDDRPAVETAVLGD